jgi:hypothetical protein
VVVWSGFIGDVLNLPLLMWANQQDFENLGNLTLAFILAWLLATVPAATVMLLAAKPPSEISQRNSAGNNATP